jgi:hypothetical protein
MSTTLATIHDWMLEGKPEGASHDAPSCPICTPTGEVAGENTPNGGSVSDKTYTEDEYNTVLAKVTDLEAKVANLTAAAETSEVDVKVAAAKAELEAQIADLQSKLDTATLEAEAAKKENEKFTAWLAGEAEAAAQAAELATRKESRIAQVKEAASFPDEYLEANADRFAAMSDETFAAALEDWKTIAPKGDSTTTNGKDDIPSTDALTAARSDTPNILSEVMGLRLQGVDTRTV